MKTSLWINPVYALNRIRREMWFRGHPGAPWMNRDGVDYLESILEPGMSVFEWGSGRSTFWLAERAAHVHTVEHQKAWFDMLVPSPENVVAEFCREGNLYPKTIAGHEPDLVLIDGIQRSQCMAAAMKTKAEWIVLDDAERLFMNERHAFDFGRHLDAIPKWTTDGITSTLFLKRKGAHGAPPEPVSLTL